MTVHILHYGLPLCGFTRAMPCDWPPTHRWVGKDESEFATCQGCRQAMLAMWVIYDHPADWPDHFVARKWLCTDPPTATTEMMLGGTLNEVRRAIPLGLIRMERFELDDPKIVEVWM